VWCSGQMVATEEASSVPGQIEAPGTFGKLRQTLSSSLLNAQDKVTKLGPRQAVQEPPEPVPTPPPAQPPPAPAKTEREAGKAPSRVGACRVCLKALKPGEVYHTCNGCQHRNSWQCSVCRRKAAPRVAPAPQDSTDSLLEIPVLDALQRRHSEARLGSGGASSGLAPPRSPELRRHSDVSPASLKELEKLKGGGSKTPDESRRPSTAGPARRRSVRTPRQRSCDEDQPPAAAGGHQPALAAPPPMSRRASAVDVVAGATSRRGSYRPPDDVDSPPQISGLTVDEDRPIRRRGSQLPDIAALQQRTGTLSALSSSENSAANAAAAAAAAAAARQMSVDAEAIKIVIHDVDDSSPRRVSLRRDPNDKGHRSRGFGMRVVGGKPDASGRREAIIVWTVPGGPADMAGLTQGDKPDASGRREAIIVWTVPGGPTDMAGLTQGDKRGGDSVELLVEPAPQMEDTPPASTQSSHHHHALYEPDTDKSPSSPTRRKLPKTPEQDRAERAREQRPAARAQLQVWFESELRKLVVVLIAADDLPSRDHTLGYGDEPEAFARIRLLPSLETCPPVETDPASASCNPVWNATLGFGGLTADLLAGRAIELTLWDACPGIDPLLISECTMEVEKAFAEERAVWWTLEERGVRSANTSPRGSLTGARALRRGDFASQRSVSDDVDSIGECASLLHPDHAWVGGSRRGSSQSETLEVEVYQLGKDFSHSLPGSRRSSFQQAEKEGAGAEPVVPRRNERRRSSCVRRDPDDILRSLRAVKGELGRTLSLSGSTAR
ncbi:Fife, isoform B, partial [Operophtera brumata]